MRAFAASLLLPCMLAGAPAAAQQPPPRPAPAAPAWPEAWFEIFKLAPGKHEEFIRRIAGDDEVAKAGGQAPTQLFFHQHGGDWDVILFKPVSNVQPTPEQEAAMEAKRKELGVETGPAYFVGIRELVAAHEDSKAHGPLSAEQWLARLDQLRREEPPRRRR